MQRSFQTAAAVLLAAAAAAPLCRANMYDVVMPSYSTTCKNGCAKWSDAANGNTTQPVIDAMFADSSAAAGQSCAMPANHAGDSECDCGQKNGTTYMFDSYEGPWCFCKDPEVGEPATQYCNPPYSTPEQINLQVASDTVVVIGFVTYETTNVTSPPTAAFGPADGASKDITGVSHWYEPPGRDQPGGKDANGRYLYPYTMSYVRFEVKPGAEYMYKVKSGSAGAKWSAAYKFRAPRSGVTRIATYGDMGHSHYNNMGNMRADCEAGNIDSIVHMGDHAYNIGFSTDRRGDAYMNAFQHLLTVCPWFPVIGNHEASDGDHFKHYEAIAYGEEYGLDKGKKDVPPPHSTATSALGAHLTTGTFYGMGLHGPVPSNTSRYASTDIGLVHVIGLDLNSLDAGQLAWLEADLISVNQRRDTVPWIMATSHFPVFHSQTVANKDKSLKHYLGDENLANYSLDATNMDYVQCDKEDKEGGCATIGDFQLQLATALQPLFKKYGVDIYNAGHVHSYESSWPLCDFTNGTLCPNGKSFDSPQGTIHITEGNGGVPGVKGAFGVDSTCGYKPPPTGGEEAGVAGVGKAPAGVPGAGDFCRMTGSGGAYARITAYNATTLVYEHVANNGGNVTDTWTVTQPHHGAFEYMADV